MKHDPVESAPEPAPTPDSLAPDPLEPDPLASDPRVLEHFGSGFRQVADYAELLAVQGVERGLIGPGEVGRLWSRHILNSAAIAPHLPDHGTVLDVGTGAGLPGVVLAIMRPDLRTILLEPMERRVTWLREVVAELRLDSAEVLRGRAEDLHGELVVDAVTARAVAPLSRLVPWTLPLLSVGGVLLAMKGNRAAAEIADAEVAIRRLGGSSAEICSVGTIAGVERTTLVRILRTRG